LLFNEIYFKSRIKLTKSLSIYANQDFYNICFKQFDPTDSAYNRRSKFDRGEHSAMAKGENYGYGSTLRDAKRTVRLISASDQPGRKQMYHYIREAKSLLS
jgi:hypothetical protein